MNVVMFYHSFVSCWNHGNAHFLRGIARELIAAGHTVTAYEPVDSWSRINALQEPSGEAALLEAEGLVPGVGLRRYQPGAPYLDEILDDADLVLVHEWTDEDTVREVGRARARGGRFTLLFHDTHHRVISAPAEIDALDLDGYDGILTFGETLAEAYRMRGWGRAAFVWHEAADTHLFRPLAETGSDADLVWVGNWGDGERARELQDYLLEPVADLKLRADVYGVRYPRPALEALQRHGIRYAGWLPNHRVPQVFAGAKATVHVPRGPYTKLLRGIPTIRMFEALACGIPLVSAPWHDDEQLFPQDSYLKVNDSAQMTAALRAIVLDPDLASDLARKGLVAVRARHTCAHRVEELLAICASLKNPASTTPAPPYAEAV